MTAAPGVVLLLRHARTPSTGERLPGRDPGLHLSEAGRAEAAAVAGRLTATGLVRVVSSPLERARETADAVAVAVGLPVEVDDGLVETDTGVWTGRTLAEVRGEPGWAELIRDPARFRFPAGESIAEVAERVVDVVRRLVVPGAVVLAVSHNDPIRLAVLAARGEALDHFGRIDIAPAELSAVELSADGALREVPVPDVVPAAG